MREHGGHKIAGGTVTIRLADPNARRGKCLKFLQRGSDGMGMSLQNSLVRADQGCDRNRFGRREREVIKNPAIGRAVTGFIHPRGIQPLRQCFAGCRVLVLTET